MGYYENGIPKDLVLALQNSFNIENFVETGTYMGETTFWASRYFSNVFTIEIFAELSNAVASRPNCPKNIRFIVGDSGKSLHNIVPELKGRTLFWLDGHYSGPGTGGEGDFECPVLCEIEAASQAVDSVILIDDARCFFGPPPPPLKPENWPTFHDIAKICFERLPHHHLTIHGDVILCIPNSMKTVCDSVWSASYSSRYPTKAVHSSLWKKLMAKLQR
jgi:hypothetical protein